MGYHKSRAMSWGKRPSAINRSSNERRASGVGEGDGCGVRSGDDWRGGTGWAGLLAVPGFGVDVRLGVGV
jgi:MYXO-CTERM domain-containing protein